MPYGTRFIAGPLENHEMKLFVVISTTTFFFSACSVVKSKSCCNLKYISQVKHAKINLSKFQEIDTIVGSGDFEKTFNRMFVCRNGTLILGNVNSSGEKHGEWSFKKDNATGYEGHISGEFKNGKMDGYWAHGPYSSLYKNGRHVETKRIPF